MFHPPRPPQRPLEAVQAKGVLCGGVSEDHVRVVEHVEAIQRQRVDFQVVQGELGVDVEADVCGQGAREVLGQAGGRLSTDCREAERSTATLEADASLRGTACRVKLETDQSTSDS